MSWIARALLVLGLAAAGGGCARSEPSASADMPLDRLFTTVADVPVGAKTGRFDYLSFDPESGRLFVSKMGSGKLLVFDGRNQTVVAELNGFPKVTGVLAVPSLHRVYASVPGAGIGASVSAALGIAGLSSGSGAVAILDSDTLKEVARVPGGVFPDGIAYDSDDAKIFVSDELGGAIDVVDARTNKPVARIDAGGEVGNVQYDRTTRLVFAPVQSRNALAIVDPKSDRLVGRFALPGGEHPHGLRIAPEVGIAYVACDGNDRLLVVDLKARQVLGTQSLGHDPDVLADDPGLKRLYVAGESGVLAVFDTTDPVHPRPIGRVFAGDNAHSVAVDPETHRLFLPLRNLDGRAAMRIIAPKSIP
jgi:DNA-binding beta-propeller fold protein YncE